MAAATRIVTIADRPDLVPVVAAWLWEAFDREGGLSPERSREIVAASTARIGVPQTFVLLADERPVATASFVADDCPERPHLTPWLASVYVGPEARGLGFARRLVEAVEAAARQAGTGTLWLFTHTAEPLYARLGWRRVEQFERRGRQETLMRRDFPSR